MLNSLALSTLIFLILYVILFFILLAGYHTKRIKLRSRYSLITFHVLIRLASQSVGLAFGIIGFKSFNLLIAYLILGAEVSCFVLANLLVDRIPLIFGFSSSPYLIAFSGILFFSPLYRSILDLMAQSQSTSQELLVRASKTQG